MYGVSSTGEAGDGMFLGYHTPGMAIVALNSSSVGRCCCCFLVNMVRFLRAMSWHIVRIPVVCPPIETNSELEDEKVMILQPAKMSD